MFHSITACVCGLFLSVAPQPADLVLTGGRIITVDAKDRVCQAIAVHDGRVVALGTDAEISRHVGPATKLVRLAGRTVLPGLIESHVHAVGVAQASLGEPYVQLRSIAEIQQWIRQRAARCPPGTWIEVPRNDITRLAERRHPTPAEFDAATTTHPVAYESARKWALNSLGLRRAGLDDPQKLPRGARIVRDSAGKPLLVSGVDMRRLVPYPKCSPAESVEALVRLFRVYNRVGITSIYERASSPEGYKLLGDAIARSHSVRATVAFRRQMRTASDVEAFVKELALRPHQGDEWLRIGPLKMTCDGGIHWGNTHLGEPYGPRRTAFYRQDDPTYRGDFFLSEESLCDTFTAAHRLGWQVCVHVTGDAGVDRVLSALEASDRIVPARPHRFTITHAYFPSAQLAARAGRLGVCVDTQPYLYYKDSDAMARVYGPAWAERFIGLGTWQGGGVVAAINSDHMIGLDPDHAMNSFNPLLAMSVASRRVNEQGVTHGPDQRVSRLAALRMVTSAAAWIGFNETQVGSLEPGKLADLVVINRDFLTCPEPQLPQIKIQATLVGGRLVYGKL